jgi:hypothetical protein
VVVEVEAMVQEAQPVLGLLEGLVEELGSILIRLPQVQGVKVTLVV